MYEPILAHRELTHERFLHLVSAYEKKAKEMFGEFARAA